MAPSTARSYRTRRSACAASAASTAVVSRGRARGRVERRRIRVQPQRRERLLERAPAEQRRGRRPERSVAFALLRPQLAAERDQLGEIGDGVDVMRGGDADEAVRVEVVAEEQRRVVVGRLEETRPSVVDEVALVDRLEAERVPRRAERGEDRRAIRLRRARQSAQRLLSSAAPPAISSQRSAIEARDGGDRPLDLARRRAPSTGRAPRTATAGSRRPARAGGGTARRSARCRTPARRRSSCTGASVMNSVRSAPTRWTRPNGASPSSSRAALRSSSS